MKKKVLLAGESWVTYSRHIKGFDSFFTSEYEEGMQWLKAAIEEAGYEFVFISNTYAAEKFPVTIDEINEYAAVMLSDIGSNTLLLTNQCFKEGKITANRCQLIKDYVLNGGGFCMIGGYLSFSGVNAAARYGQTAVADILPVEVLNIDDRNENPQGVIPQIINGSHEIFKGIPQDWPFFLGYNKTLPSEKGEVLATINGDPFVSVGKFGKGRSAAFTSDCSPHWAPPGFVNWQYYNAFWKNLVDWLASK